MSEEKETAKEIEEETTSITEPNIAKAIITIQEQCEGLMTQLEDAVEDLKTRLEEQKTLLEKIHKMLSW